MRFAVPLGRVVSLVGAVLLVAAYAMPWFAVDAGGNSITLSGQADDDRLVFERPGGGGEPPEGLMGTTTLDGGDGDDNYVIIPQGTIQVHDSAGNDTIDLSPALQGVVVTAGTASGTVLAGTTGGLLLRAHPLAAGVLITASWAAGTWRGIHHLRAARR